MDLLKEKQNMMRQIEGKIPSITDVATTTTTLNAVENKIANASNLVKKTDYDAKIPEIAKKYFTTSDCNKFTSDIFNAKIKEKGLINKSDICK